MGVSSERKRRGAIACPPSYGADDGVSVTETGLAHDYLLVMRGAERTFEQIAHCFPHAPVHTLLYDEAQTGAAFAGHEVHPSALQRLHVRQGGFRRMLPLFPWAIDHMDVTGYDLLVSSSSSFSVGLRQAPDATHVCYCHSPFRYVWHERDRSLLEVPRVARPALARELDRIRRWDIAAASRVDHFIANSEITRQRIADYWHREAEVIHPPVEVDRFEIGEPEDYLLIVGEIVAHKRVGEVLAAAAQAGRRVKVVGAGPEQRALSVRFAETAEFLGRVDDDELATVMAGAQALVVSAVEEFGIVAVEAQAAGRPVIGPDRGGTVETVIDGQTGVLYPADDFDALAEIMRDVDFTRFDPRAARESAARFHRDVFRRRIVDAIARTLGRSPLEARAGGPPADGLGVGVSGI